MFLDDLLNGSRFQHLRRQLNDLVLFTPVDWLASRAAASASRCAGGTATPTTSSPFAHGQHMVRPAARRTMTRDRRREPPRRPRIAEQVIHDPRWTIAAAAPRQRPHRLGRSCEKPSASRWYSRVLICSQWVHNYTRVTRIDSSRSARDRWGTISTPEKKGVHGDARHCNSHRDEGRPYVHSAPSALCRTSSGPSGGVLGVAVEPRDWTPQPAQSGSYRARALLVRRRRLRGGRRSRRCDALEPLLALR